MKVNLFIQHRAQQCVAPQILCKQGKPDLVQTWQIKSLESFSSEVSFGWILVFVGCRLCGSIARCPSVEIRVRAKPVSC